jgi:hypothetical protein
MESREQRISTLASTLKTSGIAKSDSQARMMAEEMIGVEEHVQRNFEEKHAAAHEYLQTSKNLGNPRYIKPPLEQKSESKPDSEPVSRKIEPIALQGVTSKSVTSSSIHHEPIKHEYTDVSFGKKTLSQAFSDHDTHNAALESIKNQVQRGEVFKDVDDLAEEIDDAVAEESEPAVVEVGKEELEVEKEGLEAEKEDALIGTEDEELVNGETVGEETSVGEETAILEETPVMEETEEMKLDTEKLVDMMEEDGKLEEHTREITEKPKDVKPKEEYEENNIDLSSVFGVHKK